MNANPPAKEPAARSASRYSLWIDAHSQRLTVGCLALALGVIVLRYLLSRNASLSYDEATYVEMARHPWRSSYYRDPLFVRHPPLYFWLLGLWTLVAPVTEASFRFFSLLLV